jgi:hypothetical protein
MTKDPTMLKQRRLWISTFLFALACALPGPARAAGEPAAKDAKALAAAIDRHIAARWEAEGVKPSDPADDAEFMRRVYLDLAGKVPAVSEVREFLEDRSPDKRQRLVEDLLDSPAYVNHFTNVWRAQFLPENPMNFSGPRPDFDAWLRKELRDNVGYDQMVREVLTAGTGPGMASSFGSTADPTPVAFYQVESTPEALAARASRLFLGVKLECAQCHDHKFTDISREQFWQLAAFFTNTFQNAPAGAAVRPQIQIPGTQKTVQARFLDDTEPQWTEGASPRVILANWVATAENPYFARAAANRFWAHFFGIGLVDPYDDLIPEHEPSHPELLDELARQFALNHFDVKYLIRAITLSRTYQLSSAAQKGMEKVDPHLFARAAVRGLTPDQLLASLAQATGHRDSLQQGQLQSFGVNSRVEFLAKFSNPSENPTVAQTSILQALAIMNGRFMDDVTALERSEMLAAVADGPFHDPAEQIETLYLATLTRKPSAAESARLVKYVTDGGPTNDSRKALGDVFWALLNSGEFVTNH